MSFTAFCVMLRLFCLPFQIHASATSQKTQFVLDQLAPLPKSSGWMQSMTEPSKRGVQVVVRRELDRYGWQLEESLILHFCTGLVPAPVGSPHCIINTCPALDTCSLPIPSRSVVPNLWVSTTPLLGVSIK